MNKNYSLLLFALLSLCIFTQNVVVVSSSLSTTTVVSPPGQNVGLDAHHNLYQNNFLGNGAQWIWVSGANGWPDNYSAVFQTLFYSDCPQTIAQLLITVDNSFVAYLNGLKVANGTDWTKLYSFPAALTCGLNNLTIVATNRDAGSPAALIFSITQDQKSCYDCSANPSAFYSRKNCQCECSTECLCPSKLQQWVNYPVCGCKCNKKIFVPCDPITKFWSEKKCNCECKKKWCLPGQIQDSQTCQCVTCPVQQCKPGYSWNAKSCQCEQKVCVQTQFCVMNKIWCPIQCACVCKERGLCPSGQIRDQASCTCRNAE